MALTGEARSAVPQELIRGTIRAASSGATGVFSPEVVDLIQGVLQMMAWQKVRLVAVGAVVAAVLTAQALSQQAPKNELLARQQRVAVPAARKPSEQSVEDRRWVRSLPSGETIEVVGVSSFPSGPDSWWRPDGTPLRPASCDPAEPGVTSTNMIPRAVVVRLTGIPEGADQSLSISEAQGMARGPARRNKVVVPGLIALTAILPADTRTCTFRLNVASGPWHTELTADTSGAAFGTATAGYIISDALAIRTGTSLNVTHDVNGMALRIIALDGDRQEHPGGIRQSLGVKNF